MSKPVLVTLSAIAFLAFPGAVLGAGIDVGHDLDLDQPPGWTISSFARDGVAGPPGRAYQQLLLDSGATQHKAKGGPRKDGPSQQVLPLHANLVSAGREVLEVKTAEVKQAAPATPTPTSVVPLPGALWMFGTALLAFIGIASRHKF
jgi:hypothetical protein